MSDKSGGSRASAESTGQQSMAQIREILFGEQVRHTEQQFARLDARLEEQHNVLRAMLDEQIGRLGNELAQLRDGLDAQDRRQDLALQELNGSLSDLLRRLDERLTLLDSDHQDTVQRQQRAEAEQAAELQRVAQQSAERAQLAELLEQMAARLRQSPDQ